MPRNHRPDPPAPGSALKNGAITVKSSPREFWGDVVLGVIPGNTTTPFATWTILEDAHCIWGVYHKTIEEALTDFAERASVNAKPEAQR